MKIPAKIAKIFELRTCYATRGCVDRFLVWLTRILGFPGVHQTTHVLAEGKQAAQVPDYR